MLSLVEQARSNGAGALPRRDSAQNRVAYAFRATRERLHSHRPLQLPLDKRFICGIKGKSFSPALPARRQSDPGGPIELISVRLHEGNVPRNPRDDKIAPTPHSGLVQSCAALAAGPVAAPVTGEVLVTPPVLSPIAVGKNAETQRR